MCEPIRASAMASACGIGMVNDTYSAWGWSRGLGQPLKGASVNSHQRELVDRVRKYPVALKERSKGMLSKRPFECKVSSAPCGACSFLLILFHGLPPVAIDDQPLRGGSCGIGGMYPASATRRSQSQCCLHVRDGFCIAERRPSKKRRRFLLSTLGHVEYSGDQQGLDVLIGRSRFCQFGAVLI